MISRGPFQPHLLCGFVIVLSNSLETPSAEQALLVGTSSVNVCATALSSAPNCHAGFNAFMLSFVSNSHCGMLQPQNERVELRGKNE